MATKKTLLTLITTIESLTQAILDEVGDILEITIDPAEIDQEAFIGLVKRAMQRLEDAELESLTPSIPDALGKIDADFETPPVKLSMENPKKFETQPPKQETL